MKWPWTRRPPPPTIPPYKVPVAKQAEPKVSGIEVEEVTATDEDLEAMRLAQSQTGMHRVWRRLTGQDPSA